jgi:hypothetical protein
VPAEGFDATWIEVPVPNTMDYIKYRYDLHFERSDEYEARTGCTETDRTFTIPEDQYDPLALHMSDDYSLVEALITQELAGGIRTIPGETVLIPAHHRLIRLQRHDVYLGTVYVERWNKFNNSPDWYRAHEASFPITYTPREYFRWFEPCHDQGSS